jgi:hypothetical protein
MTAGLISQIVTKLSDEVVARLAAASYPPLAVDASGNAGRILIGRAAQFEQAAPPRIIFVPTSSAFGTRDIYSRAQTYNASERREQNAQRAIAQEAITFEVRVWGQADPPEPTNDFDITRSIYHCVRAVVHDLCPGAYELGAKGEWTDATFSSSQLARAGREFVFDVTLFTPVLTSLLPYDVVRQYAPAGVAPIITDGLQIPTGVSPELGC